MIAEDLVPCSSNLLSSFEIFLLVMERYISRFGIACEILVSFREAEFRLGDCEVRRIRLGIALLACHENRFTAQYHMREKVAENTS